MGQSDDILDTPQLDYEAWRALVRSICARHNPVGIEPNAFLGWARPLSVCGLAAVDLGWNAHRIERTHRDVRLDGVDHYCALFQLAGQSTVTQNDQSVRLAVGDVALVDMARPATYFASNTSAQWLALHLPRHSLVSHLGFEPQGRFFRRDGTPPGRLLFQVVQDAVAGDGPPSSPADSYMQLAVYDLVGALCTVRRVARLTPCGQAVHADPRRHQEWLCRSGFWPWRGGSRSRDLVALPPEALYGARLDLQ
jgi:AraC family transcriptional regulator, positive regulator of tynA and feaB